MSLMGHERPIWDGCATSAFPHFRQFKLISDAPPYPQLPTYRGVAANYRFGPKSVIDDDVKTASPSLRWLGWIRPPRSIWTMG
jgi:hypothetical protein